MGGRNDSADDAKRLVELLRGGPFSLQLLLWNEVRGIPFKRPSLESAQAFRAILTEGQQP